MLSDRLEEYSKSGIYPFHMPGHKRRADMLGEICARHDLTEVEGTDDLHCPNGILKEAMDNAAEFFGAARTFFLVGGSTVGILSALAACTKRGGKIICARNCHKSVYNGIALLGLNPRYVLPPVVPPFGIHGSINPADVERALKEDGDAQAVILTSPTYEGIISDIGSISEICRRYGAVLIVDEAHGAHLGHFAGFPAGAVKSGADIVIQSAHKTLGALTQSALLHVCGDRVNPEDVARKLAVFETSSPSYLIMESIDGAICRLQADGKRLFREYSERLDGFSRRAAELKSIDILLYGKDEGRRYSDIFAFDRGKLIISALRAGLNGAALSGLLLKKYKIQTEMSSLNYVIAMTSYCDSDDGFDRLFSALADIDAAGRGACDCAGFPVLSHIPDRIMNISDVESSGVENVPAEASIGRICGEFVLAYPPGVPLIVPGEVIDGELVRLLRELSSSGVSVKKSQSKGEYDISVLKP